MTKEDIMEGNKVMAEYLGYKYYPHTKPYGRDNIVGWLLPKMSPKNPNFHLCRSHRDLPFYTDWHQLMRVVYKIEREGLVVSITKESVAIHNWITAISSRKGFAYQDKLKNTWEVCLEYINKNRKVTQQPEILN